MSDTKEKVLKTEEKKETVKTETKSEEKKETVDTAKFKHLIDEIEKMNLKELNDFVKVVQDYFDVVPMAIASNGTSNGAEETKENTKVSVFLTEAGQSKIAVIKAIGSLTGKGLMDSKKMLDKLPATIATDKTEEEAEAIKKQLVDAGAIVEIK